MTPVVASKATRLVREYESDPEALVTVGLLQSSVPSLPWGGMGLFVNVGYQQELIEQGCDVFIAGESDNYGFRFAAECAIPMIETSHEISENPGLRRFAEILSAEFPGLDVRFYENACTWRMM